MIFSDLRIPSYYSGQRMLWDMQKTVCGVVEVTKGTQHLRLSPCSPINLRNLRMLHSDLHQSTIVPGYFKNSFCMLTHSQYWHLATLQTQLPTFPSFPEPKIYWSFEVPTSETFLPARYQSELFGMLSSEGEKAQLQTPSGSHVLPPAAAHYIHGVGAEEDHPIIHIDLDYLSVPWLRRVQSMDRYFSWWLT